MRIVCEECRKAYDYEKDDFCPRCGAYNPPPKNWTVNSRGEVIRVDGINEANHAGSFAHREVHQEKATRRALGLDRPKPAKSVKSAAGVPPARSGQPRKQNTQSSSIGAILAVVFWIFVVFQLLRIFMF